MHAPLRWAVLLTIFAGCCRLWIVAGVLVPIEVQGPSMAPTLWGSHVAFDCRICGKRWQVTSAGLDREPLTRCPWCSAALGLPSGKMVAGERVLIDRLSLALRRPRRWQLVVLRRPDAPSQLCIKRVVGLPGELIRLSATTITIDGTPVSPPTPVRGDLAINHGLPRQAVEPGTLPAWLRAGDLVSPKGVQLGADEYFVMGDNVAISQDSRSWTSPAVASQLLIGYPVLLSR